GEYGLGEGEGRNDEEEREEDGREPAECGGRSGVKTGHGAFLGRGEYDVAPHVGSGLPRRARGSDRCGKTRRSDPERKEAGRRDEGNGGRGRDANRSRGHRGEADRSAARGHRLSASFGRPKRRRTAGARAPRAIRNAVRGVERREREGERRV